MPDRIKEKFKHLTKHSHYQIFTSNSAEIKQRIGWAVYYADLNPLDCIFGKTTKENAFKKSSTITKYALQAISAEICHCQLFIKFWTTLILGFEVMLRVMGNTSKILCIKSE